MIRCFFHHAEQALGANYIFASLNESDISLVLKSMEIVDVEANENIITQGKLELLLCWWRAPIESATACDKDDNDHEDQ